MKNHTNLFSQQNIIDIGWLEFSLSLTLLAATIIFSFIFKLHIGKSIFIAGVRAAIQLVAVGLFFTAIFEHSYAQTWAWVWTVIMTGIATVVLQRRVPNISGIAFAAFIAIGISVAFVLAIIFPFGIIEDSPVNIVVMAGITIGNLLPTAVLAVQQLESQFTTRLAEVEALLALGSNKKTAVRFLAPQIIRTALTTQIERTKVVGLIALPGVMTGLLLAGAKPLDAVLVQLIVMYMILGSVTLTVCILVWLGLERSFTDDLRLKPVSNTGI